MFLWERNPSPETKHALRTCASEEICAVYVTITLRNTTLFLKNKKHSLCLQTNTLNCHHSVNINEVRAINHNNRTVTTHHTFASFTLNAARHNRFLSDKTQNGF